MSLLHWLFPTNCLVCHDTCVRNISLCQNCESQLPWLKLSCQRCGLPFAEDSLRKGLCAKCLGRQFPVDECHALFSYDSPVRELINSFKHQHRLDIGNCLARQMTANFASVQTDLLLPVPVSYRRFCGRGFNQSWELTRQLSRELEIPCSNAILKKNRHTRAQSAQASVAARRRNLQGAFSLSHPEKLANVNTVTIVDDVVTTMTTVNSLAKLLKRQGIPRVQVLCVARTCA